MKIISLLILLLTICSCKSRFYNFNIEEDGIAVEKKDSSKSYDENYNIDNTIFTIGRTFIYSYYYENSNGTKFLISKGNKIQKENYFVYDWKFVEFEKQSQETIKSIILKPKSENPFIDIDSEYNQTAITYDYIMNDGESFSKETTGAIENKNNTWIHPPRSNFFQILELNPFPYIKSPYKIGTKWNWKLKIGDYWSDIRWLKWEGSIENNYNYEIVDKKIINTKLGKLDCFIIKSSAESRIGTTELVSYFNVKFGFVKLEYKNIDNTKTVLELEKIE